MNRLAGKVAIVTGGSVGMGAAIVRRFVAEGARVVITDVQVEQGAAMAAELGAIFVEHDVSDDAAWRRVMAETEAKYGRLDVVANNAGIFGGGSIEELDLAMWHKLIAVNQTGVMLGCHYGITLMRKNPEGPKGSLINTASSSAYAGLPGFVGYTATKGAVRLMTKSIAAHCARAGLGIRCNAIIPGAIRTPMLEAALAGDPAAEEHCANMSPLSRIGTCEEIAAMAAFLAADESSYCTGSEFLVDGGALAIHPGH